LDLSRWSEALHGVSIRRGRLEFVSQDGERKGEKESFLITEGRHHVNIISAKWEGTGKKHSYDGK